MSNPKPLSIQEFFRRFPDDDACLDHLLEVRYGREGECPKCGKHTRWSRVRKEMAYACQWCGWHVHPMAGTPFERTRTPLQKWFFVVFMFTTTRNGVSAKEIQRQCAVTYKTAWRMGHEIRKYMGWVDGDTTLGGPHTVVEVDETRIGGKDRQGFDDKHLVLGMVERGGDVLTRVVPSVKAKHLMPHVMRWVRPGSRVATDEHRSYRDLRDNGYRHGVVNHSADEYVRGPVHVNTIEGFWSALKRGIKGTHIWVSKKHLPKYLGEFEYRFNLRASEHLMFDLLLSAFPKPEPVLSPLRSERGRTA
jgi:transposase